MAAEALDVLSPPTLLLEPDRPRAGQRAIGWHRVTKYDRRDVITLTERVQKDDAWGAVVQHAIVRYLLSSVTRAQLASEVGVTDTTMQLYLRGAAWSSYGRPVLRALQHLGIGTRRGSWTTGERQTEITRAALGLLNRVVPLLEDDRRVEAREIVRLARLLTAALDGTR